MTFIENLVAICLLGCVAAGDAYAQTQDFTCFQEAAPYMPETDIGADVAIVYGAADFAQRARVWRDKGYDVSFMTGIAWGDYGDYYGSGADFKRAEVQTTKTGRLFMHGDSTTVGYNVPSPAYVDYIKRYIEPALEAGVRAVYLEEPEYWAETGWSDAFKLEWRRFYGEDWRDPDSSPDAQYRASKLKYELYFNALKEVFEHVDRNAPAGMTIECHVPTHSLINYAQWRIVSPESHLIDIPQLDGYVAQVWTGTARSENSFEGLRKERTFETAYCEYGQMFAMVRPTGRKVWFLADPIEDNPNHSWNDYKTNYECTVIASLFWPEVHRYEVMPWPSRIFKGTYPVIDMDSASGAREGIPSAYATQILTVINALNEMNQSDVVYETGSRGIGVVVSDTLMFQRAEPQPSDAALGHFYGLALPLIKGGVPIQMLQLENILHPSAFDDFSVLLLTYDGQKPLKPEYHDALVRWIEAGGALLYVGDESDPYNHVREWWNEQGKSSGTPAEDLFKRLGLKLERTDEPQSAGRGFVSVLFDKPGTLLEAPEGTIALRSAVSALLAKQGLELRLQNYLKMRRGPFVIASVLDESVSSEPLTLEGQFVDLFDPNLPVVRERTIEPDRRVLFYDLDWAARNGLDAKVVAAGARVRGESLTADAFSFEARGPVGTAARARVLLPFRPKRAAASPEIDLSLEWDDSSSTALLSFPNLADTVTIRLLRSRT